MGVERTGMGWVVDQIDKVLKAFEKPSREHKFKPDRYVECSDRTCKLFSLNSFGLKSGFIRQWTVGPEDSVYIGPYESRGLD